MLMLGFYPSCSLRRNSVFVIIVLFFSFNSETSPLKLFSNLLVTRLPARVQKHLARAKGIRFRLLPLALDLTRLAPLALDLTQLAPLAGFFLHPLTQSEDDPFTYYSQRWIKIKLRGFEQ